MSIFAEVYWVIVAISTAIRNDIIIFFFNLFYVVTTETIFERYNASSCNKSFPIFLNSACRPAADALV